MPDNKELLIAEYDLAIAREHGISNSIFLQIVISEGKLARKTNTMADGDWFILTLECVKYFTALTSKQQRRASKYWQDKGVIDARLKGLPRMRQFKINREEVHFE